MRHAARRHAVGWCVLVVLAAAVAPHARAATVVDLGPTFVPIGINADGVIVGDVVDPEDDDAPGHAAVWADGTVTPLTETAGTELSDGFAISDTGRVVGLEYASAEFVYAAYWDAPDEPTRLTPLSDGFDFSQALDVDPDGNMVGVRALSEGNHPYLGFYRASAGGDPVLVGLGNLPADKGSSGVRAISNDGTKLLGEIRGTDASDGWYVWSAASPGAGGTKIDLEPVRSPFSLFGASVYGLPLVMNSFARDGTVLGYRDGDAGREHFLRLPDGSETPIVGLAGLNAVNGERVVVGTVLTGGQVRAAKWDPETESVTDLNTLLPEDSGFVLVSATAIGDDGSIVGVGAHDGVRVGFLLKDGDGLAATIEADPSEPIVGVPFTIRLTVTNDGSAPLEDVTPPAALGVSGSGQATLTSGPTPATLASLAPGASADFEWTYEATKVGPMRFTAVVTATGPEGTLQATARCGAGTASLGAVQPAATTCPADGNGTAVTVGQCTIEVSTHLRFENLTLTKLDGDSVAKPDHSYEKDPPPGGS